MVRLQERWELLCGSLGYRDMLRAELGAHSPSSQIIKCMASWQQWLSADRMLQPHLKLGHWIFAFSFLAVLLASVSVTYGCLSSSRCEGGPLSSWIFLLQVPALQFHFSEQLYCSDSAPVVLILSEGIRCDSDLSNSVYSFTIQLKLPQSAFSLLLFMLPWWPGLALDFCGGVVNLLLG